MSACCVLCVCVVCGGVGRNALRWKQNVQHTAYECRFKPHKPCATVTAAIMLLLTRVSLFSCLPQRP